MITIRHAGDLGDCLYALPAVKWLCEQRGERARFLLEDAFYTRERMTPERQECLAPLLLAQPYIEEVGNYDGGPVDVNMNDFRAIMFPALRKGMGRSTRLTDWQRQVVGAPVSCQRDAWLSVTPRRVARYVISRSARYHNHLFPWERIMAEIWGSEVVFIGLDSEKEAFDKVSPLKTMHYATPTLLDAAEVIAGCECFIGNQSACYAIAEGLKKPALLEIFHAMPNCLFLRPGVVHGWDDSAELPVSPSSYAALGESAGHELE